jgi:phospholipid transport system substrate-binding protein
MMKEFARKLALAAAVLLAAPAFAQEAPDAMVKRVSQDTLATIRSDPLVQSGDQARIRDLIEVKLVPNFDFTRMTALAMGRNWRNATPEQQKQLTDQFRALLVRTYAGALNQYRSETIDYKPFKMNPDDTEVTVRTQVTKTSGQPVSIDYSLEKTPEGWKAYDVIVAGVSLVTNYRDEFSAQIKNGGIDGLVKTLADRNKGAPAK